MREVNLEHDVDRMVVLADDLQTKVDSKGQKVESCPNGKEGIAGQRWKRFQKKDVDFFCLCFDENMFTFTTISDHFTADVNREIIFSCPKSSVLTYKTD